MPCKTKLSLENFTTALSLKKKQIKKKMKKLKTSAKILYCKDTQLVALMFRFDVPLFDAIIYIANGLTC